MMGKKYRQMLVDEKTYKEIDAAKKMLSSTSGRKPSFREVIDEFLGKRLRFLSLKHEVRSYINAFVSNAALNRAVVGLMLFGSVARNDFGRYSDTDVLTIVNGKALDHFDEIAETIESVEDFRKPLILECLYLRINPLLLSEDDLNNFRPIYVNLVEEGIILFERNDVLSNFMDDIRRKVDFEKKIVDNVVVVKWNIKA